MPQERSRRLRTPRVPYEVARRGQPLGADDPGLGERADADPVPGVRPPDQLQEGPQRRLRLHVDVPAHLREGLQQLLEERYRLLARHPRVAHLFPAQVGDPAGPVRHPVQGRVVEGDELPVPRGVDVRLDVAVARVDRVPELAQRVLQAVRGTAPVGEGDRTGMVEVGVAYRGGHRRSIALRG
jgi:hypothetical protein